MQKPKSTLGLCHVALHVRDIKSCIKFYTECLGMHIEWQPDPDNVYLTNGHDNLALHRTQADFPVHIPQRLDHLGFSLRKSKDIDAWYLYLKKLGVTIKTEPRNHRDGARSFYCADPDGNLVQILYHPPLVQPFKTNKLNQS